MCILLFSYVIVSVIFIGIKYYRWLDWYVKDLEKVFLIICW